MALSGNQTRYLQSKGMIRLNCLLPDVLTILSYGVRCLYQRWSLFDILKHFALLWRGRTKPRSYLLCSYT